MGKLPARAREGERGVGEGFVAGLGGWEVIEEAGLTNFFSA